MIRLVYRRSDGLGLEHCAIEADPTAIRGRVLDLSGGFPVWAAYRIGTAADGATCSLAITCRAQGVERRLAFRAQAGRWYADGTEVPALRGALDVDLSVTPATNVLPIRRLGLSVGEGREVLAAWVRFLLLAVRPLRQRYERVSRERYLYRSDSGYSANCRWRTMAPSSDTAASGGQTEHPPQP